MEEPSRTSEKRTASEMQQFVSYTRPSARRALLLGRGWKQVIVDTKKRNVEQRGRCSRPLQERLQLLCRPFPKLHADLIVRRSERSIVERRKIVVVATGLDLLLQNSQNLTRRKTGQLAVDSDGKRGTDNGDAPFPAGIICHQEEPSGGAR